MTDAEPMKCAKCGQPMPVPPGLELPMGFALSHAEGECPDVRRHYRITIRIARFVGPPSDVADDPGEVIAGVGATIPADTFMEALPVLQAELNKRWDKLIEVAGIVESDETPAAAEG